MHARTHVRHEHRGPPGLTALTEYADGMVETDAVIGNILDTVDEIGIADNTIVIYTTDNGPHQNTWPDAGTTPFRSEKNTNWEGAYRVPALIRWPGQIEPGTCTTASSPASTGSRRWSPPPATRTSPSSCSMARRSTARSTRTISTASTSSPT